MQKNRCETPHKLRCVIIGAAPIATPARVRSYLRESDFVIYCDGGLYHRDALGVPADLLVGDFDSHPRPAAEDAPEILVLPCEKDDTDTVFAVREGLRRGFDDFLLLGVVGGRLDHTLGNLSILLWLHGLGKNALLVDDASEMQIVDAREAFVPPSFPFFSLLAVDGTARGITEKNAKYPLENAVITPEFPYGISNEPLPGQTAVVSVARGRMLLIRVFGN